MNNDTIPFPVVYDNSDKTIDEFSRAFVSGSVRVIFCIDVVNPGKGETGRQLLAIDVSPDFRMEILDHAKQAAKHIAIWKEKL